MIEVKDIQKPKITIEQLKRERPNNCIGIKQPPKSSGLPIRRHRGDLKRSVSMFSDEFETNFKNIMSSDTNFTTDSVEVKDENNLEMTYDKTKDDNKYNDCQTDTSLL